MLAGVQQRLGELLVCLMPNRSYFVPESFEPDDKLIEWAKKTFNIAEAEIERQLELCKDHEFRRPYSCWTRVFRNWLRKCEELGTFRRERKLRQPEELSEDERQQDLLRYKEQMEKYGVKI